MDSLYWKTALKSIGISKAMKENTFLPHTYHTRKGKTYIATSHIMRFIYKSCSLQASITGIDVHSTYYTNTTVQPTPTN